MALAKDRNTQMQDAELVPVPVAASAVIYAGALVVANANGYAAPGAVATTLTYLGRAEEYVNNASGGNGAKTVLVRRKKAFLWKNHGADLVTQAAMGKNCYIVDDETVALTNGTNTRSVAGIVLGVSSAGVLVE
jgi:hypothetical protein